MEGLFLHHARSFTSKEWDAYRQAYQLPDQPLWTDNTGRQWGLLERLTWFGLTHPRGLASLDLFDQQLQQRDQTPWDKATLDARKERVEAWLVAQRHYALDISERLPALEERLQALLQRSLAGQPEGMPSCGLAKACDKGWLGMALESAQRWLEDPSCHPAGWQKMVAQWFGGSLAGASGGSRWWAYGKVKGTLKNKRNTGDPGWEAEGSLPGEPEWQTWGRAVRPSILAQEGNWERLAAQTLGLWALAVEKKPRWDVQSQSPIARLLDASDLTRWSTPPLRQALWQVVKAGVGSESQTSHPVSRFEGTSLEALQWLWRLDPGLQEVEDYSRQYVAQQLFQIQQDWMDSPRPQEQAMAFAWFSPAMRLGAEIWPWVREHAGQEPAVAARRPRP